MKKTLLVLLVSPFIIFASELSELQCEYIRLKSLPVYELAKKDNPNISVDRRAKRIIVNHEFVEPKPIPKPGSKSYFGWLARRKKFYDEWCAACREVSETNNRLQRLDELKKKIAELKNP